MTPTTLTWLIARLDEQQFRAQGWADSDGDGFWLRDAGKELLREVESKRALVAVAAVMLTPTPTPVGYPAAARTLKIEVELAEENLALVILKAVALTYAGHDDFPEELRP